MTSYLQNQPTVRVLIFDGYLKIPVFTIGDNNIELDEIKTVQDLETYQFNNWKLIESVLNCFKDCTKQEGEKRYSENTRAEFLSARDAKSKGCGTVER